MRHNGRVSVNIPGPDQARRTGNFQNGDRCVVGIDFGTLSGRALVVRIRDGAELGTAVHDYKHGVMDSRLASSGEPLPADWALQDPEDYRDVLRYAVPAAVADAGIDPATVIGIGTDFTACTVLPVTTDGTPLCQLPEMAGRPHAYPKLWKHHAAQPQADRINELARVRGEPWLARYGGKISAEWQFAKALQLLEEDPDTYQCTDRWIEAADWIIWQLTGVETRNACTAGYKGILQDGSYPSPEFLGALNPRFASFAATRLAHRISPLGGRAGSLTSEAAAWTGLSAGIAVAVGNVDAHVTAPAAKAIGPGQMVAIMGTSTCHVMNAPVLAEVPGMCGVVDGGIVAGTFGYEAGQSGVGDIFAWFADQAVPPAYHELARRQGVSLHELLSAEAAAQPAGAHGLLALDWLNGNRSVLVDHHLSGAIVGLTLASRPPEIYRALLESTAFGTRVIIDAFQAAGVPVTELVIAGGLLRNELLLQIYSDVTRRPLSLIGSDQGPALGSALHAAVAAGAYPDVRAASAVMGRKSERAVLPHPVSADVYDRLYADYVRLHDYFGRGANDVMHRLRALRDEVNSAQATPDQPRAADDDRAGGDEALVGDTAGPADHPAAMGPPATLAPESIRP
jgi:L-ribulokinase